MSVGIIAEVIKQQDIAYKIIESDKYQICRLIMASIFIGIMNL